MERRRSLEVDTRVSEELKLFDVLHHCLGLLLHECLHERRRANGHADANHALNLHDVLGGVVVDSEDVLEAVERLVSFHEALHLLPCLCQGQAFDIDLALGEADVQSCDAGPWGPRSIPKGLVARRVVRGYLFYTVHNLHNLYLLRGSRSGKLYFDPRKAG